MSTITIQDRASDIIDHMVANGATFDFRPAANSLPPSFTFSQPRGGDRWKCRGLILEAKSDPALWAELVAEIGRHCGHGGAE